MVNEIMWINTKNILNSNEKKIRPCHKLGYCPYGCIVEMFPLKNGKFSCKLFGHDCPMYYNAEDVSEQKKEKIMQEIAKGNK